MFLLFGIILVIAAGREELALVIYYIQPWDVLEPDIYLVNRGFSTIKSILECTISDISRREMISYQRTTYEIARDSTCWVHG